MPRLLLTSVLTVMLALASSGPARADQQPVSMFPGTFVGTSPDGTAMGFQMSDGHIRWEVNGVPISLWGVNDTAMASALSFSSPLVLVPFGAIRGTYFGGTADGTVLAFKMPDGSVRWEINGLPIFAP